LGTLSTPNSVQKLQKALHAKAKAEPGYRFYALYDKISREDILAHAYAQCRSNKGAPGVDRQDFEAVASGRPGDRAKAVVPVRARNGRRRPERTDFAIGRSEPRIESSKAMPGKIRATSLGTLGPPTRLPIAIDSVSTPKEFGRSPS
jgi:hypothetical protein